MSKALPTDTAVSYFLREYHTAIQALEEGKSVVWGGKKGWNQFDTKPFTSKEQFTTFFRSCLDRKINTRGGIEQERQNWKNWLDNTEYVRDSQTIRNHYTYRIAIHSFNTKECRQRLAHLITPLEY